MDKIKQLWKKFKGSYVVYALLSIITLDFAARATYKYWPIDTYNSPNRSWVWYAVKDFRETGKQADIVLLGSSLMMATLHGGDATYFNHPVNAAFHHRSYYLEKLLKEKYGLDVHTFAFAIGGQMVSDAYILASRMLVGDDRPKMLIYGIAPRDFMDNTLASCASTETYRYIDRIKGLSDLQSVSTTSPWEKVEKFFGKVSFIYQHRLDFVYMQNVGTKKLLASLFGMKDLDAVHTPFALRGQAMLQLPEDTGPAELCIVPYDAKKAQYANNMEQYRYRYLPFKPKAYNLQMSFLERLLKWGKDEGVQIVLVNMPITEDNLSIMPSIFYPSYLHSVQTLAHDYGAQLVNLNDHTLFPKSDFEDSVHLNGKGGVQFWQVLTDRLFTNSQVAQVKLSPVR
jgi:hypothetical protein